jgi:2-hydroxy-3-keto-5-methylthiopentenyl-1-phosphate phosphatase
MQFFQDIILGFITFGINTVLGGVFFVLLRPYIRNRVEEWIQDTISSYIREQLSYAISNANETAKTLAPLINAIIREVMKDFQQSQKEQMVKIPILGKLPAPLVQAFLERFLGGSSSKNEGSNPFA